jgi:hypothetical protein
VGADHEVACEGGASRRPQHRLGVPAVGQRRHGRLSLDPVAQVHQHRLAAHPGHSEAGPAERGDQDDQADEEEHQDAADPPAVEQLRSLGHDDHHDAQDEDQRPWQPAR